MRPDWQWPSAHRIESTRGDHSQQRIERRQVVSRKGLRLRRKIGRKRFRAARGAAPARRCLQWSLGASSSARPITSLCPCSASKTSELLKKKYLYLNSMGLRKRRVDKRAKNGSQMTNQDTENIKRAALAVAALINLLVHKVSTGGVHWSRPDGTAPTRSTAAPQPEPVRRFSGSSKLSGA